MSILNKAIQLILIATLASTSLQSSVFAMQSNSDEQQVLTPDERHQLGLQLIKAARSGDLSAVNGLISRGAEVNLTDEDDYTPLHWAACNGRIDIVNALLGHGAEINMANRDGSTALHTAAQRGNTDIVIALLDHGAEVNMADKNGSTALHTAVFLGYTNVVKVLLRRGAEVNMANKGGNTPLHWAVKAYSVKGGRTDIVNALLKHGAEVNMANKNGETPLQGAAKVGHHEIVKLLERERDFPLHSAAALGNTERLRSILRNGADINTSDDEGKTPIELAANHAIKDMLIEYTVLPFDALRKENPKFPMDLIKLTSDFLGPASSSAFEGMY